MTDAEIVIGIRGDIEGGKRIQRTLDDIERSGKAAQNNMGQLKTQMNALNNAANTLATSLRTLGIAFGLRQIQQMADAYTNIQNRLKLVTEGTENLAAVTKELFNIANTTRQSFETTAEVYSRMALATKDLGLSQRETLDFVKSLNQAVAMSGASTAEATAGMIQLSQGLASGALRGDELRSVLEQLPAVADVIAKGLGVTRGELRQLGQDGKISAEQVISAFKKASDDLDQNFAKTAATMGQAFVVLKNDFIAAIGEFDQATGVTKLLAMTLETLGDAIATVLHDLSAVAYTLRGLFTDVVGTILSITNAIVQGIEDVVNTAIKGINYLRKEDIAPVDFNGGLTSQNIVDAQSEQSSVFYNKAGTSLGKANASAMDFWGYGSATAGGGSGISNVKGVNRVKPPVDDSAAKAQKQIDKVTESLKFQLEQLKRTDTEQEIYNNLRQAGVSIDTEAGRTIAVLTTQYQENSAALDRQKRIVDGVAGATEGFFKTAIQGSEGFKGALKGLIGQLADLAFQLTVIEPIKNNIFGGSSGGGGLFGSILGSIGGFFGGGVTSSSASVVQAAARGAANPALYGPGFASGGSMILGGNAGVDQNQLSLNGMPIARVGRGETLAISPDSKSGNPVVVNQTINLSMGVQEAVAAQFATIMPQLTKSTQAAIEEAQARGIRS